MASPRGRPSKLTPELRDQLMQFIGMGVTIADACGQVGISKWTFYHWKSESERLQELADALWLRGIGMPVTPEQTNILTFSTVLTRAHAEARVVAIATIRSAMFGLQQVETSTETFTETRIRKGKGGEDVPYEYRRQTVRNTTRNIPGDWKAAIEYLKRRVPEEWGDRLKIDPETEALRLIRNGEIAFEPLAEEVGIELARELFAKAGIPTAADGED